MMTTKDMIIFVLTVFVVSAVFSFLVTTALDYSFS